MTLEAILMLMVQAGGSATDQPSRSPRMEIASSATAQVRILRSQRFYFSDPQLTAQDSTPAMQVNRQDGGGALFEFS